MCTAVHGYSALQRKLCWQREAACPASEACDHRDHLLHHLQWPTDDAARDGDDHDEDHLLNHFESDDAAGDDHDDHKTIVLIEELTMMMGIEILVWDFKQEPTS